ncbi:hypothetical protein D3C85_1190530 [compost metagenome]
MNRRVWHAQAMRSGQCLEVILQRLGIHARGRVLLDNRQCRLGKIDFENLILADLYQDLMAPPAAQLHFDSANKESAKTLHSNFAFLRPQGLQQPM